MTNSRLLNNSLLTVLTIVYLLTNNLYSQGLSQAKEAYDNLQFDLAIKSLKKVWKKNKTDNETNYILGKCILKSNSDRSEAIQYLETVIGNDINYKDANFQLAKAYTYSHEFDKARKVLDFFTKNYNFPEKDDIEEDEEDLEFEAQKLLGQINTAEKLITKPLNVSFVNLGPGINSKRSDYNPFISKNGRTIYYSSDKKYDSELLELINNIYYSEYIETSTPHWQKMKSIGKDVNSYENEIIVGLSKDEEKIILNVSWMKAKGDIFITSKGRKKFKELTELEKIINSEFNEQTGTLSKNEDTLYFCSNRPGGEGGQDLYIAVKLPDGTWGKAQNLGKDINTKYNETFPYINEKGDELRFASDRPESMGGFDIFTSHRKNNQWVNISNLGYPINNAYDNYMISFSKSKRYGYVAQTRPGGYGFLDIYQVIFNDVAPQNIIYTGTIKKGNSQNSEIIKDPIKIVAYNLKTNKLFAKSKYSKSGKYTFAFPPGEYKIKISGSTINPYEKIIRIPENEHEQILVKKNILVN